MNLIGDSRLGPYLTLTLFFLSDKKVKVPRNVCQAAFELASNSRKRQFRVKVQCCTMRPYCTELCIEIKKIGHHITTSISYKFSEKNLIFFSKIFFKSFNLILNLNIDSH